MAEGSTILLQTSALLDRNGHVVPDGTLVEFDATYLAEGGLTETFATSETVQGRSPATLVLDRVGLVEINARAGEARSMPLQIDVRMSEGETLIQVQTITPTATVSPTGPPTAVPTVVPTEQATIPPTTEPTTPSATVTYTRTVSPIVEPTPTPAAVQLPNTPAPYLDPRDLLSPALATVMLGVVAWSAARMRGLVPLLRERVRLLLCVAVGVWAGYDYFALQMPAAALFREMGGLAPALFAWGGGIAALLVGLLWPDKWKRRGRQLDSSDAESGDERQHD